MKDELENLFKKAAEKEEGNFKEEFWETYQTGLAKGSFVSKTFGLGKIGLLFFIGTSVLVLSILVYVGFKSNNAFADNGNLVATNSVDLIKNVERNKQENQFHFADNEKEKMERLLKERNVLLADEKESQNENGLKLNEKTLSDSSNSFLSISVSTTNYVQKNQSKKPRETKQAIYSLSNSISVRDGNKKLTENSSKSSNDLLVNNDKIRDKKQNESSLEKTSYSTNNRKGIPIEQPRKLESEKEIVKIEHPENPKSNKKTNKIEQPNNPSSTKENNNIESPESLVSANDKEEMKNKKRKKLLKNISFPVNKSDKYQININLAVTNDFVDFNSNHFLGNQAYSLYGFGYGLDFEYWLKPKISISQGIGFYSRRTSESFFYSSRSSQIHYERTQTNILVFRNKLLEFPLNLNWAITKRHKIGAGLRLNVLLGSNYILSSETFSSNSENVSNERRIVKNTFLSGGYKRTNLSYNFSYQFNFKRLGLQLLYVNGITPVYKERYDYMNALNHKKIQLSLTYKIF